MKQSTLNHSAACRHTTAAVNRSGPSPHGPFANYSLCRVYKKNTAKEPPWQFRL